MPRLISFLGKGCIKERCLENDLLIRHFPEGSNKNFLICFDKLKRFLQGSRGLQDLHDVSDNEPSASGDDYDSEGATNSEASNE